MQCYVGGRRSGKTTRLIELSHDTGIPIVAHTIHRCRAIERQAHDMGKEIPKPQYIGRKSTAAGATRGRRVLVDEMGSLVESVFCVQIVAASIDGEALTCANPALASMGLVDAFRCWRRARRSGGVSGEGEGAE